MHRHQPEATTISTGPNELPFIREPAAYKLVTSHDRNMAAEVAIKQHELNSCSKVTEGPRGSVHAAGAAE